MEGFESFVGVNFWTALLTLCNMIITFLVLKKFLFKPVKKMIDDRQQEIDGLYADASNAKTQAEALQAQYDARLKAANAEGDRIIQNATRQAQEREEAIVHEAQEKAARTMERAHAQVEREKKQAMNDLKDQVSGMAIGIASAVLEEDVDKRKHAKLIDSFIENLGEPL